MNHNRLHARKRIVTGINGRQVSRGSVRGLRDANSDDLRPGFRNSPLGNVKLEQRSADVRIPTHFVVGILALLQQCQQASKNDQLPAPNIDQG